MVALRVLSPPPAASFFDDFPDFVPDPSAGITDEFYRLAELRNWKSGSKKYKRMWDKCMQSEYVMVYDYNPDRLKSWQNLCTELGFQPPDTITQCKKLLSTIHVNIVDVMDCRRTGESVKIFSTVKALQTYTRENHLYFPRAQAKWDGFTRILLRNIV